MCRCCSVVLILLFGVSLRVEADETETPTGPAARRSQDRKLPNQRARLDKNDDGRITSAEIPAKARNQLLARYDKNKDEVLVVSRDRERSPVNRADNQRRPVSASRQGNRTASVSASARREVIRSLPRISSFLDNPSDRFLVDLNVVRTGHPYKGEHAKRPHTGGHVYFHVPEKPIPATDVDRFPPIYAVADGVITRVDYSFRLREIYVSAARRRVSNTRYGIGLMFATSDGHAVEMHYSIEPFIDPGDDKFYDRFIFVKVGQRVKKGDVIARMYIPPDREIAQNTHIHFNLIGGRNHTFQSPSIFDGRIVKRFHATWDERRGADDGAPIPPCMGYKLAPHENPFDSGPKDAF